MALKPILNDENEYKTLPEVLRPEYKLNGEGKYVLDVDGGMVPNARLDEMRTRNLTLIGERDGAKKDLEKFANVDLAKYEKLAALEENLDETKFIKREGLDKLVEKKADEKSAAMKNDYEAKLAAEQKKATDLSTRLFILTVDNEAAKHASENHARPEAIPFIVDNIRGRTKLEDGKPVLYKADGTKDYDKETHEKSIATAVKELIEGQEWMQIPNSGGGGGSGGSKGGGGGDIPAGGKNPWKKGADFSLTECMKIVKKNPQLAARLKREAGVA